MAAALTSVFGFTLCVLAWAIPLQACATSIVVDARTGVVLASSEPTLPWPPASLTKLLTLYLTFATIEDGLLDLDQELEVSAHAAGQRGSRLGLAAGDEITVREAILAVITRSGNDAAMVLAQAVSGTEAAFVTAMNERARALGLVQSYFVNPTGLPDPRQTTSARDMALLAQALWHDYPQHYHFFATRRIRFGRYDLPTINGFLTSYRGADGLKTGTTCDAGYNLVASAWSSEPAILPRAAQTWPACSTKASAGLLPSMALILPPFDLLRATRGGFGWVPALVNLAYRRFPQVYQRCPAGVWSLAPMRRISVPVAGSSWQRPASVCLPISANQQLSCSGMQNTTVPFWLGSMRIRQHLPT